MNRLLSQTYLIAIFEFAVVRAPLLHSVIGQMNQPILDIPDIVLAASRAQVPLRVKITLHVPVNASHQCE